MAVIVTVDLQVASTSPDVPDEQQLHDWAKSALLAASGSTAGSFELSVRLVDEDEGRKLNLQYRQQDNSTNVLSFPFDSPAGLPENTVTTLGDLVVCVPVVEREAGEQNKAAVDHWAHMVIHGTLHLLGYDHESEAQATAMEALEINILRDFGIENPYREN
jgi:probable rRNA maturation factor